MTNIFSAQSHFEKYANVKSHLLYSPNSKEPEPVISILIPTFNDSPYFEEALMSALSQEGDFPYEIIICDNTPLRSGKNKTQKIGLTKKFAKSSLNLVSLIKSNKLKIPFKISLIYKAKI